MTLEIEGLTKRFGPVRAVDDLSFVVRPGLVTGFLGPNGSGKTTTLRCLLDLVAPSSGSLRIGGRRYRELDQPLRTVGAVLEASGVHPGRTGRAHLRSLAQAAGLPRSRVEEVLGFVGMEQYADRRTHGYSLGMKQRLGLAQALLGDPGVLVLDEPANGLDPAGVAWLRRLLRSLAAEGRTVLVSSHVLSEVQQTVDEVVVIARGKLVVQGRLAELEGAQATVRVRSPEVDRLCAAVLEVHPEAGRVPSRDGVAEITGLTTEQVGRVAHHEGVELHELAMLPGNLERLFLELTHGEGV